MFYILSDERGDRYGVFEAGEDLHKRIKHELEGLFNEFSMPEDFANVDAMTGGTSGTMQCDGMDRDFYLEAINIYHAEDRTKNDSIEISWHVMDVYDRDDSLDSNQAQEVLQLIKNNHDANFGVCWETIDAAIDVVKARK